MYEAINFISHCKARFLQLDRSKECIHGEGENDHSSVFHVIEANYLSISDPPFAPVS
jgi:hypothetical protein